MWLVWGSGWPTGRGDWKVVEKVDREEIAMAIRDRAGKECSTLLCVGDVSWCHGPCFGEGEMMYANVSY